MGCVGQSCQTTRVCRSVVEKAAKFVCRSPGPAGQKDQGDVIVTTNGTAATLKTNKHISWIAIACLASAGLAGCETSNNLFGSNNSPAASPAIAPAQTAQAATPAPSRVLIAPIIGPPDAISKSLTAQLSDAAERQRIGIVRTQGEPANYTLRGYLAVPAKDKSGTKLSYIWDVTDPAGKRVNRITGEETLAPTGGGDAWGAVTPQIMQAISDKTMSSLAAWLPTQAQTGVPIAGGASAQPAVAQGALPAATVASAQVGGPTTGSIPSTILATAPRVAGAPGDGNASLAAAMRRELEEKGVQVSEAGQNVYRVAADVKIKPPKDGMQAISINWTVNDPKGVEVAKITQNNEVPAGFLDKSWGPSAEDAAKAAAVQIRQVMADHRSGKQIQSSAGSVSERKVN